MATTTRAIPVGGGTNDEGTHTTAEAELVGLEEANGPVIHGFSLSNTPETTAAAFVEDSLGGGSIPMVTVTAQHILDPEIDLEASVLSNAAPGSTSNTAARPTRAEFLSATVVNDVSAGTSLGICLATGNDGSVYISAILRGGLSNSPFRLGDKLLSFNNESCADLNHSMVARLLDTVKGTVTVRVHNVGGDASLVETMVEKPKADSKVGIKVANLIDRRGVRGKLVVTKVAEDGLIAHSLVNVGDEVISINNVSCSQLDSQLAVEIIKKAPRYVTLVTRPLSETGLVVAISGAPTPNARVRVTNLASCPLSHSNTSEASSEDEWSEISQENKVKQKRVGFCVSVVAGSVFVIMGIFLSEP